MISEEEKKLEERVLLLAPTPRDAEITRAYLAKAGLSCFICSDLFQLSREIHAGAGAVLLTEEVLSAPGIGQLIATLEAQEPWSDLPVLMLMRGSVDSPVAARVVRSLRNVMLLERPAPTRSVVSAARAAVRARHRQYQVRAQFEEINQGRARYQELREQLKIAIEASDLGTFHCRFPLGKIVWNDQCKAHFWLEPDAEVDFDLFYSIIHPEDRERTRRAVEDCVNRLEQYDIEYRTVSPTGEIRWVRAKGRTFVDKNQKPVRFDGTTQDITAERKIWQEREQLLRSERAARAESERAGRMKDEFLATLSHELRTPLTSILGWSQLIRRANDPETLDEGLAVIERNALVQAQLIEDLLDMSRIISGKVNLDIRPIDPAEFIEAAINTVTPSVEAKEIHLEKTLDSNAGQVHGDAGRLQQIVWNLLSNAIKFTHKGGHVRISLRKVEDHLEIEVSDDGQGIKPEFLPHVFERFRQADSSTTRGHGGLGLGLAIVKHLAELHGGTLTATSAGLQKGSTFTVILPITAARQEETAGENVQPPAIHKSNFQCTPTTLRDVNILVVDDEPDARRLIRRLLEECGAKVQTAGSAAEAVQMVQSGHPEILISDIGMPGVDGYQLLDQVRALGASGGGGVPAIALTAFARLEDRQRALKSGYRVHISKPVEPRELVATVANIVHQKSEKSDVSIPAMLPK